MHDDLDDLDDTAGGAGPARRVVLSGYDGPDDEPVPHPATNRILGFGLVGTVLCPVFSLFALVLGLRALAEIRRDPDAYSQRGRVQAGVALGAVGALMLVAISILLLQG